MHRGTARGPALKTWKASNWMERLESLSRIIMSFRVGRVAHVPHHHLHVCAVQQQLAQELRQKKTSSQRGVSTLTFSVKQCTTHLEC